MSRVSMDKSFMKALPERFEESMRSKLGAAFPDFLLSLQQPPPLSLRIHPVKNHHQENYDPVPWSQYGEYLTTRPPFTLDPLFHAGCYYVQEASSMFLEQAMKQTVDLNQPLNVLDLCAAPGGKSTHLLSLLNRESLLVSNETIRPRASVLAENIQKWGYPNGVVTNNDPKDFQKLKSFFDVVIIDAPCSGEGLFRKDPGAINEWSAESVQLCASRQKRIVADVWDSLAENGILIYCTCTYNETENEDNLQWMHENYSLEFLKLSTGPSWGIEEVKIKNIFAYRFFPHRTKGEGFFLSVIRKTERTELLRLKNKTSVATPPKKIQERLNNWILAPATFFQFNDLIFYTPSLKANEFEFLLQNLKIMYAGTNVATLKHEKLIPDHAMALSIDLNKENFPIAELPESDALKYLRKDVILIDGAPIGFVLLTHQQTPIGWANVLSNRVNNMYPADWRIRNL